MTENEAPEFVPYRDRPPLDKGQVITWRDLESGMLFEAGVLSDPRRRRVRGTPIPVKENGSYLIGSEDLDGTPKGGIEGTDTDTYRRIYDEDGRAVYVIDYVLSSVTEQRIENDVRETMARFIFDCWIDRAFFEETAYDDPEDMAAQLRRESDDFWNAGAKVASCQRAPFRYERERIIERFVSLATQRPRSG